MIENQLGASDDSHCLRLLGYAAYAEANILVWVAHSFTSYHRSILKWLNEADTIDVYAVTVQTYRVARTGQPNSSRWLEPPQSRPTASRPASKNVNTLYAEFYRPLVARLRQRGVQPVGTGGWRGRWRSFQDRIRESIYATGFTDVSDGKGMVCLAFSGTRRQEGSAPCVGTRTRSTERWAGPSRGKRARGKRARGKRARGKRARGRGKEGVPRQVGEERGIQFNCPPRNNWRPLASGWPTTCSRCETLYSHAWMR